MTVVAHRVARILALLSAGEWRSVADLARILHCPPRTAMWALRHLARRRIIFAQRQHWDRRVMAYQVWPQAFHVELV